MPRQKKKTVPIEVIAQKHKVQPGDFLFSRMAEIRLELDEIYDTYKGMPPSHERSRLKALYCKEAADYVRLELEVLPYFQGKKKQVEHTGQVSAEVSLLDVLKARDAGSKDEG